MLKIIAVLCALLISGAAYPQSGTPQAPGSLPARVEVFLAKAGKKADLDHPKSPIRMEDRANGRGAYISKWEPEAGPAPTRADGFSAYELHVLTAQAAPLRARLDAFLAKRGKSVGSSVDFHDNGHISRWNPALGAPPTEADGFTDHELHRIKK